ncbi:FtsX-like permease family protein [Paenibacillus sp. GD4]|uniref:FtsX-like permease family protein n=1 Tax=Paenibacillus sp. GD4 TaxID=3068890 RepID=UPI0027966C22|nr:FtsX-like permease family protein [Paenibacillus sp. GD4]MDQ1909188.1 FtsX-like permease family protein [Paenibacillus sp. GD4]
MALLIMIVRKMAKNKWLELSLLLGLVISVGLASSMPIYTSAILQRMLIKDLELQQEMQQVYPGVFWSSAYLTGEMTLEQGLERIKETDRYMRESALPGFDLPIISYVIERSTDRYKLAPADPTRLDPSVQRVVDVVALSEMEKHTVLKDGAWPKPEPVDGVYEVLVVEESLTGLKAVVGNEFVIEDSSAPAALKFRIVGVVDRKSFDDLYWYNVLSSYKSSFLVPFETFEKHFTEDKILPVRSSIWYAAADYSRMTLESITRFIQVYNRTEAFLINRFSNGTSMKAPALTTLQGYYAKEEKLRMMLWSLNVPVMIMLGYYLFMVSNLITERQKTEIAVLRSRGASRVQIVIGYLLEGLLLGAVALAIGPYLGLMLTKVLGASNGFLEFVQRAALQVKLSGEAFQYGFIAVAVSVLMTILPVLFATRATIVGHKQQMARGQKLSFWHKYLVDLILVGVSIYGLITFQRRMADMKALGLDAADLQMDPLLFLVPALFILGSSFLMLRIYPLLIQAIYTVGRKWWPPSLYSTLLQVGRSSTQYQAIMVFLSVTLATGMFSASAARTINKNASEKIMYKTGADITLKIKWENDAPPEPISGGEASEEEEAAPAEPVVKKKVQFSEPPFLPLTQLPGVEHAAKVFQKKDVAFTVGKDRGTALLMGIDTDDFGRTSWLRDGLLEHHFYDYLNVLAAEPSAVLISRTMAETHNLKPGDRISAGWGGVEAANFTVYGIVDYWPSWNPNPAFGSRPSATTTGNNKNAKVQYPMLIVGHLSYIQNNMALEPYEVWLKMKEGSSSQTLYDALEQKSIPVEQLTDARQQLILAKNDPFQLAINGVMTLGFLISIIISFCGFLLYWILSLSSRVLQLGILRAMGISFRQLMVMLVGEQLMTSGAALGIGVMLGIVTGRLFVPMFQLSLQSSAQVPPFEVTFDPQDQLQLLIIVVMMLAIGLTILGSMLSRIKIHQAVKLGED